MGTATLLTKPQAQFHHAKEEHVACVAGVGSGKTDTIVKRILTTKFEYPTVDLGYFAPTYSLINDIFYPKISTQLHAAHLPFHINKKDNIITIQGMGQIFCRSMSIPDLIVGFEIGDAHIDEFDLLPVAKAKTAHEKIQARCRMKFPDKKINQKLISTTPEGFKYTYKIFKKDPLPGSRLIRMSTYSNAHNLPEGYIPGLEASYPDELIKAYLGGKFVNLVSGAVYPYFDRDRHHTDSTVRDGEPLDIGMDFNVGKMSAVIFRPPEYVSVNGVRTLRVEAVAELTGYRDTPALIKAIEEKYPDRRIRVFPDAAGSGRNTTGATQTDHKLLQQAGFQVKALAKNPLVKERVQSVNRLWETGSLLINKDTCPDTVEALEQQVYDKNGLPDKSGDLDHPLDALGYRIYKNWAIGKPYIDYTRMTA